MMAFGGEGAERAEIDFVNKCASGSLVTLSTDVPQAWGLFKIADMTAKWTYAETLQPRGDY